MFPIWCIFFLLFNSLFAADQDLFPRADPSSTIDGGSGAVTTVYSTAQPSATPYSNNDPNNCGLGQVNADDWRENNVDAWLQRYGEAQGNGQNLTVALGHQYAPNVANSTFDCDVYSPCSVRCSPSVCAVIQLIYRSLSVAKLWT